MRRIAMAVGAVAVLLGIALVLRDGKDIRTADVAAAAKPREVSWTPAPQRHSAEVVLSIVPGAARRASAPAGTVPALSPLMAEVSAARDYRPIYDRIVAKANRTPEESYVLADLLERCAKVAERNSRNTARMTMAGEEPRKRFLASLSDKDPQRDKRLAAFEVLARDPCEGMVGVETTEKAIRDLVREAAAGGDPKARVKDVAQQIFDSMRDEKGGFRLGRMPAITDVQLDTVRSAAASRDPHALHEAGAVLAFQYSNLNVRVGDNQVPVDFEAFRDAWTLAACAYGYPCGPQMRHIAHACALLGRCGAADYREFLFFFQHPPQQSQLIDEYTGHVLRAVQGDWSRFTFHRGPSPWAAFDLRPR